MCQTTARTDKGGLLWPGLCWHFFSLPCLTWLLYRQRVGLVCKIYPNLIIFSGPEIVGKCYMKPDMKAAGDSYREDPEEEVSSPSACAELCSKKTRCNSFSFLQGEGNSGTCSFRKDQELRSRPDKGYTGGWCPKGGSKSSLITSKSLQEPWCRSLGGNG